MAIYFAHTDHVKRSKGQSAVASSAYRSASKLQDNKYGKTHNYTSKNGVVHSAIILPAHLAGKFEIDREKLWNGAEFAEKSATARTAREWLINIPYEFDKEKQIETVNEIVQKICDDEKVICDYSIHYPTAKDIANGADPRNVHVHALFTTREILFENDIVKFGNKATSELSDKDRKKLGLGRGADYVEETRIFIEQALNKRLIPLGIEPVSRLSHERQGNGKIAQIKVGRNATQAERNGIETWQGRANAEIKAYNATVSAPAIDEKTGFEGREEEFATATMPTIIDEPDLPDDVLDQSHRPDFMPPPEPEPAPIAPDTPSVIDEYNNRKEQLAQAMLRAELSDLAEKGKPLLEKYNNLLKEEPRFFKGGWQKKLDKALLDYNAVVKRFDDKKAFGVTDTHRLNASLEIANNEPDLFKRYEQALDDDLKSLIVSTAPTADLSPIDQRIKEYYLSIIEKMPDDTAKHKALSTLDNNLSMLTDEQKQAVINELDRTAPPPPDLDQTAKPDKVKKGMELG